MIGEHLPTVIPAKAGIEKHQFAVIPAPAYCLQGQAPAGIPKLLKPLDSCLRRNDGKMEMLHLSTPAKLVPAKAGSKYPGAGMNPNE
jgi:hypothetical protein